MFWVDFFSVSFIIESSYFGDFHFGNTWKIKLNRINDIKEEKFLTKKPRKKVSIRKKKVEILSVEGESTLRKKSPCLDVRE